MPITLRPAVPADVPTLSRLAKETFCETFVDGFAVGYAETDLKVFLAASYAPEKVATWLADPAAQVTVAEDEDGRLVGYTHCGANTLPYAGAGPDDRELKRIYVRRETQGTGLGRALMQQALDWLGDHPALLGVWSLNLKAQRLYERFGFEKVGEYDFMVGSTADHEFIFRRAPKG